MEPSKDLQTPMETGTDIDPNNPNIKIVSYRDEIGSLMCPMLDGSRYFF